MVDCRNDGTNYWVEQSSSSWYSEKIRNGSLMEDK